MDSLWDTGAFVRWAFHGFEDKFEDYLLGDKSKNLLNFIIGIVTWVVFFVIVYLLIIIF